MMGKEGGVMKAWEATMRKTHAVAKKRAHSIFGSLSDTSTVTHQEGKEEVINIDDHGGDIQYETYHAEKVFPNGEYYNGQCTDNFTHGQGKYLWIDGCMYVGEWCKGKAMGRGTFSWPSGATYEGNFNNGYIHGTGTYTGPNGDTYKGKWVMNLKHGYGVKSFANGDWYEGEWRRGLQNGQGKYQWENGNHYIGEWRNGSIWGEGSFVWANRNRYDGMWEDGLPKGNGAYKRDDGGYYMGNWSKDPKDQHGTYHPPESAQEEQPDHNWDPHQVYDELSKCVICPEEKVTVLPSQKKPAVWKSTKAGRTSVDARTGEKGGDGAVSGDGTDGGAGNNDILEELLGLHIDDIIADGEVQLQNLRAPKKTKRQGETISPGHKNYDLMLNLQLGIRHSVARPAPATNFDLSPSAFDPKDKIWTRFPPEGSKHTPPHGSTEFKWKDYCPLVFRTLRKLFKVDAAEYMLSICGDEALRELSSPGKSGSFFYLTNDDRYMIKTMKKAEVKVLLRMLPAYYNHFRSFENTLVTKYYGLHCVKLIGPAQRKVRFIIMGNLFASAAYAIHRRFDLKGSSLGRTTNKAEADIDENTILKDLDLNFIFRLRKFWFQEFCRQIDKDCELLEQEGIMDYSLLVGVHFRDVSEDGDILPMTGGCRTPGGSRGDTDSAASRIRLGVNTPARVERTVRTGQCELQLVGEPIGEFYNVVLYFGVIDILQDYDISKKLEHAYKSIQYDSTSISAVDPRLYSRRFRDFIFKIFVED